ncbi:glycogen synthase GlgA [Pseudomonas matsuisoli]|uniref:Glycogen synthase n=1 Tax=Pseudomonas matsuisoli TaxID=1515666 RepID=A0A917PNL3_9PSED|nr:glycogen synthase GlgA [Pseudomonas matsuisoli]GGJ86273.1 glycogen synthase [Pseudomonas matsuisoli]
MSNVAVIYGEALNAHVPDGTPSRIKPNLEVRSLLESKRRILFVTSEMADLIKVGGLGDVSSALPRALRGKHDVRVLIPGFPQVVNSGHTLRIVGELAGHAALPPAKIGRIDLEDGLIVYVLVCPELYERSGTPYGDENGNDWADNHIRFARLGLAAADLAAGAAGILWNPELVHANDWPAGLAPAYLHWRKQPTPSIFTVHNLAYLGLCEPHSGPELGVPRDAFDVEGMEFYGKLSLLKAGISYANHVTTVSDTYAHEITTEAFGCGLEGLLRTKRRSGMLSGIPNGIDESWDSETDDHLIAPFSTRDWVGRDVHAAYTRNLFGLDMDRAPLFAVVSRLVYQKGVDLTLDVAESIVEAGGQLAVIGRGEPALENAMRDLARRHPGRIGVNVGFNETDARRMYAGSDFLLMPSRYEPCGLSQMYAQRYGSLPIARRTGGLADTIDHGVTGFLFDEPTAEAYRGAIRQALEVYKYPDLFHAMRCRAMAAPFFWHQSVQPYDNLYQSLLTNKSQVRVEH